MSDRTTDSEAEAGRQKSSVVRHVVLIAVLSAVVYLNALPGGFVWRDIPLVRDNPYLTSWSFLPTLLNNPVQLEAPDPVIYYRPLTMISFLADRHLWGDTTTGYHLVNLLLHVLVSLCFYRLAVTVTAKRRTALLIALLFAVHPVHTEAVTHIASRGMLLSSLLLLIAVNSCIRQERGLSAIRWTIIIVCYGLALLSQESVLVFPLLLLVYYLIFGLSLKAWPRLIHLIVITAMAAAFSAGVLLTFRVSPAALIETGKLFSRLPGFFAALSGYLRLLVYPAHLRIDYGNPVFSFTQLAPLAGMLIFLALLCLAVLKRSSAPVASFGIMWFLVTLLPFSGIIPLSSYMAERYFYLPSMGCFLLAAHGLHLLEHRRLGRKALLAGVILLIIVLAALTIKQNTFWKDSQTLYERALQCNPDSWRVYNNLGIEYKIAGEFDRAIGMFKKAIEIEPQGQPYVNLGNAYAAAKEPKKAIIAYLNAIKLKPDNPKYHYNLGNTYNETRQPDKAIASFKRSLELDPTDPKVFNNLGNVYGDIGMFPEAEKSFLAALGIDPVFGFAHINLSAIYYEQKKYSKAVEHLEIVLELGMDVPQELIDLLDHYR